MRVTFLGTGTSHGVPTLDCLLQDYAHCPRQVCRRAAHEPRYRRSRASILVQTETASLLVDTSQDFRQQMLENDVRRIDAVLYTHGHADHIYGLPDIRSYNRQQGDAIDVYGSQETLGILAAAFDYVFSPPEQVGGGIPLLRPHVLAGASQVQGVRVLPVPVEHGPLAGCWGYRLGEGSGSGGGLAYLPDVKRIPEDSLALLAGLDVLILNCLRYTPHVSHLSLAESLAYAERLAPRRCFLTHLTHDIDYAEEEPRLPEWIRFAYDGLVVTL